VEGLALAPKPVLRTVHRGIQAKVAPFRHPKRRTPSDSYPIARATGRPAREFAWTWLRASFGVLLRVVPEVRIVADSWHNSGTRVGPIRRLQHHQKGGATSRVTRARVSSPHRPVRSWYDLRCNGQGQARCARLRYASALDLSHLRSSYQSEGGSGVWSSCSCFPSTLFGYQGPTRGVRSPSHIVMVFVPCGFAVLRCTTLHKASKYRVFHAQLSRMA